MSPSCAYSAGQARFFVAVAHGERAARYVELVQGLLPGPAELCDIGAGLGQVAVALAGRGHRVWALEPDSEMRGHLIGRHGAGHLTPLPWAVDTATPDLPRRLDLVCCFSVLHLLDQAAQQALLAWAWRQLRPGGLLLLELATAGQQRRAHDWQAQTEVELGESRLRMQVRLQGSDDQGWRTGWRFEQWLGALQVDAGEREWAWRGLSAAEVAALIDALPGARIERDWADELGTPYAPGLSPRRLLLLGKAQ